MLSPRDTPGREARSQEPQDVWTHTPVGQDTLTGTFHPHPSTLGRPSVVRCPEVQALPGATGLPGCIFPPLVSPHPAQHRPGLPRASPCPGPLARLLFQAGSSTSQLSAQMTGLPRPRVLHAPWPPSPGPDPAVSPPDAGGPRRQAYMAASDWLCSLPLALAPKHQGQGTVFTFAPRAGTYVPGAWQACVG